MPFQQAVVDKHGKAAFAEIFRRPPVSTQQILHPEKYFAAVKPCIAGFAGALQTGDGYKGLIGGTFGELDHQILLEHFTDKQTAGEIAAALARRSI